MTFHSGPEYTAPDDQRCEALVKGHPNYSFEWMRHDHRCPKGANQMRGSLSVCHLHARAKRVIPWPVNQAQFIETAKDFLAKYGSADHHKLTVADLERIATFGLGDPPIDVRTFKPDEAFLRVARQAVDVPHPYGHSDVGDVFVRYLKGEMSLRDAIQFMEVTYLDPKPEGNQKRVLSSDAKARRPDG